MCFKEFSENVRIAHYNAFFRVSLQDVSFELRVSEGVKIFCSQKEGGKVLLLGDDRLAYEFCDLFSCVRTVRLFIYVEFHH